MLNEFTCANAHGSLTGAMFACGQVRAIQARMAGDSDNTPRSLIITGTRLDPGPTQRAYHQMQVRFGDFGAEVELPVPVDESQVSAAYVDGFLRIVLPKRKPHQIDVQQ